MDFAVTPTQSELKAAARRYLGDRYPTSRIAELAETGELDLDAWAELERQGWLDPELGIVELTLLAEEGGRALHPVPWWATTGWAVPVFQVADVPLPGPAAFADGSRGCHAAPSGDGWFLCGEVPAVVDARAATEIVVAAPVHGEVALFGVRPDAPGVSLTDVVGIDPLRVSSNLELGGISPRLLVGPGEAAPLLASISRRASVLLAGEAIGVADRALALATEYAQTRTQFDRPIGSYQGVSYRLADVYMALALARSLAYRAAWCVSVDDPAQDEAVATAAVAAARAAVDGCENTIQAMGGIGFTWDHPLHRYYKRAQWIASFDGTPSQHRAELAELILG